MVTMPMQTSEEFSQLLTVLMQDRPCLWQKSHPNYRDSRTVKNNIWVTVAQIVNDTLGFSPPLPHKEVMRKWANLRDTYFSNKRWYTTQQESGGAATQEPVWRWWGAMQFLNTTYKEAETEFSLEALSCKEEDVSDVPDEVACSSQPPSIASSVPTPPPRPSFAPSARPVRAAAAASRAAASTLSQKRKRLDGELLSVEQQLNLSQEDEFDVYGRSIGNAVRGLTRYQFAIARQRIADVLFDVEFNTEPTPSRQSSPPPPHQPSHGHAATLPRCRVVFY